METAVKHSAVAARRKMQGTDPIDIDAGLERLLSQLGEVKTHDEFAKWRVSFLGRYEAQLQASSIDLARSADDEMQELVENLIGIVFEIQGLIVDGDITCRNIDNECLRLFRELYETTTPLIEKLDVYITPALQSGIENGFNKHHLGAVLLRNEFAIFDPMRMSQDVLTNIKSGHLENWLAGSAYSYILDVIDDYIGAVQGFCLAMLEMGLYPVLAVMYDRKGIDVGLSTHIDVPDIVSPRPSPCCVATYLSASVHTPYFPDSLTDVTAEEELASYLSSSESLRAPNFATQRDRDRSNDPNFGISEAESKKDSREERSQEDAKPSPERSVRTEQNICEVTKLSLPWSPKRKLKDSSSWINMPSSKQV